MICLKRWKKAKKYHELNDDMVTICVELLLKKLCDKGLLYYRQQELNNQFILARTVRQNL